MKVLILVMMICSSGGSFTGCLMDGCENTLSSFVDIAIDGFNDHVEWQRTDLLTSPSRGCVSNGLSLLICAVDMGYVSINATNGQLLWSIGLDTEEKTIAASLPIVNFQGFSIVANSTRCTLIDPQGGILGTFDYNPLLVPPLAGPFVTDDGQIIVADLISVSFEHISCCFKIYDKVEHPSVKPFNFEEFKMSDIDQFMLKKIHFFIPTTFN
jgi:hypothetical protein